MAFERKDNSGAIFKNKKREEGDSKPNMNGSATVDGVEYWIAAWTNEPAGGGDKYLSLKFQRKDQPQADQGQRRVAAGGGGGPGPRSTPMADDEIPF